MNVVQSIIDRQLGIVSRFNYDNILKRLVVTEEESFYGAVNTDQDPPIFACRFAETAGYEHILALANEDGRVVIQDTSSRRAASRLEGFQCHNNAVFDLAWAPSQMSFVTVSGDHTASLWDLADGTPKRVLVFSSHTRSVKTAVFPPRTPSVFATGARDGHILLWDIRANNQPNVVLKPDNCLVNCHSSFTPKTPGSHGKRRAEPGRALSITGLAFQDDHTLLSCGECDGNIKAWDLRKNYSIYKREPLPKHSIPYCGNSARNGYTNLVLDSARVRLYASCMDHVIYCFNVAAYSAVPERRYVGHENSTFYIKAGLSPDGLYLVSGSSDTHAYVWNLARSEPLVRLAGHRAEVTCAAWAPRAPTALVTCSDDARHSIWRVGRDLPDRSDQLFGRAEPLPRARPPAPADRTPDRSPDRSPAARKRRRLDTPASAPAPRAKRCLADLMGGAAEAEVLVKRLRLDAAAAPPDHPPHIPRSPSPPPPPTDLRVIAFTTPTKNLPDFVADGEAPHLRLMSPARKRRAHTDWLTRIAREKRARPDPPDPPPAPAAPIAPPAPPARRNSNADRTPRTKPPGVRTLLTYFNIDNSLRKIKGSPQ